MESEDCLSSNNKSNCVEELNHVDYITAASNRAAAKTFTMVDVYNKLLGSQQSGIREIFSEDSDEEEEEYEHNAEIAKQYEEPSHVPHKPLVLKRIATETEQELPENGEGQKRKETKKKRKCRVSICTVNCKHKVVRQIAMKLGMRDVGEDDSWNLYWADISLSLNRAKGLKRFQKINHFPGMSELCRKDLLARNLNRMLKLFPSDYNFFPKTWCLPADYGELVAYARAKRNQTYICKPTTGCQGRGIFVTKNVKEIKPHDRMVCQVYISRPFLVDGFKFDLRIFVLITSCDPLRIYVYNDGLVRFATSRYQEPTISNISNVFMHLTNYSVNKHSPAYIMDEEVGSKRKISTLTKWLLKRHFDVHELWSNVDDVILKTVIAAHPILKHSYHACFPAHDFTFACFELLGFDILLDYVLKPFVLEVNHSPSFHTDTQIDCDIKESLLKDTFIILNLTQADKKKVIEEDRRRVRERLLHGINCKIGPEKNGHSGSRHKDHWKTQVAWEESHLGNFRCIYPFLGCEKYDEFFHQNQSTLFLDTAASRAREECARMHREELEVKAKEAFHKCGGTNKLHLESPLVREKKPFPAMSRRLLLSTKKYAAERKQSFLNSFEPGHIIESEEQERCVRLAQRDFLLRRLGVTEQITRAMKKNGFLNLVDEKKFKLPRKEHNISYPEDETSNKLPSILPDSSKLHFPQEISRSNFFPDPNPRLSITCNNAPIIMRPHIPCVIRLKEGANKGKDVWITKTHMARSVTNTHKLQELERREHHFQNQSCS